jgi:VIT1/CCC1 family predicted Fe2+/Mn2+ transporter
MSDARETRGGTGTGTPGHPGRQEPHGDGESLAQRLNWLRAGVLGANDGIVSVAATVVGVAAATTADAPVLIAGVAAVAGGAISMALGEYVSVSSSSDSQTALIHKERRELAEDPEGELEELVEIYRGQGLSAPTARRVAEEFTALDPIRAHLRAELNLSEDEVLSPWRAAGASFLAFLIGALLPFLTIVLAPTDLRIPLTFAVTLVALALTGAAGAWLGGAPVLRPTVRVVVGGVLALAVTFAIGALLGSSGAI